MHRHILRQAGQKPRKLLRGAIARVAVRQEINRVQLPVLRQLQNLPPRHQHIGAAARTERPHEPVQAFDGRAVLETARLQVGKQLQARRERPDPEIPGLFRRADPVRRSDGAADRPAQFALHHVEPAAALRRHRPHRAGNVDQENHPLFRPDLHSVEASGTVPRFARRRFRRRNRLLRRSRPDRDSGDREHPQQRQHRRHKPFPISQGFASILVVEEFSTLTICSSTVKVYR